MVNASTYIRNIKILYSDVMFGLDPYIKIHSLPVYIRNKMDNIYVIIYVFIVW